MGRNLLTALKFKNLVRYTATSTSVVKTTGVDMSGYDEVAFWLHITTGTTAHEAKIQASSVQSTASADNYVDLEGTALTLSTASERDYILSVSHPPKQYVRLYFAPSATVIVETIDAIRGPAAAQPVTNTVDGTMITEFNANPSSGTA